MMRLLGCGTFHGIAVEAADDLPPRGLLLCKSAELQNPLCRHLRPKAFLIRLIARKTVFGTVCGKGFAASLSDRAAHIKGKPFLGFAACDLITDDVIGIRCRPYMIDKDAEQTAGLLCPGI